MRLKKIKFFINYRKEEKWINEMASTGLHLTDYKFGRYYFEEGEPGKYDYCMEYLEAHPTSLPGKDYIEFLAEGGIDLVAYSSHWAYFRKEATDEPFEIYSDAASKKNHLKRVTTTLMIVWAMNLFFAISNTFLSSTDRISFYVAFLNWFIVIPVAFAIISYWKIIRDLSREDTIYTK